MTSAASPRDQSLVERLNDPATVDSLHRLLDRAVELDRSLSTVAMLQESLPNLVAIATDAIDEKVGEAARDGIDIEQRMGALVKLFVQVTEPKTLSSIQKLFNRIGDLEKGSEMLEQLPNLFAIAVDFLDEWATQLKEDGIDLEVSIKQGLRMALWFGQRVSADELDRLGFLLRSDVLNDNSLAVLGLASTSLAKCHVGSCEMESPDEVGMLGMMKAMRDPNVRRATGFMVRFMRCFGNVLTEHRGESGTCQS